MKPIPSDVSELLAYCPLSGVFRWRVAVNKGVPAFTIAGTITNHGYRVIGIRRSYFLASRLAFFLMTGRDPVAQIDHVNRIKTDDRWCNLRPATAKENCLNRGIKSDSKSGIKGVGWSAGKWRVRVKVGNVRLNLGRYIDLELAELVAEEARLKYHGDFCNE